MQSSGPGSMVGHVEVGEVGWKLGEPQETKDLMVMLWYLIVILRYRIVTGT